MYHESKTKRHRPKISSGSQNRLKLKQERPKQKKRKVHWTSVKGSKGRCEYGSDILLKSSLMANKLLFCFLCLILGVGEERVLMTNAKEGATEIV